MFKSVGSRLVIGALLGATFGGVAAAQGVPPGPVVNGPLNSRPLLAPHYQPFRLDTDFGFADIPDQGTKGGSVAVEPKLNVMDNLAVGLRVEAMIAGGGNIGAPGSGSVSMKENIDVATMLKGDFFLSRGSVRPWVGLGVGTYDVVGQGVSTDSSSGASVDQKAGRFFGVAPQVGLEMGGFRLAATYNDVAKADVVVTQSVGGGTQTKKYSDNYFTLSIGFRMGGRKL